MQFTSIKEKIKEKHNKGITLIALVVTIIVLLILAGVTVSTLAGDNGIINNAKKAVSKNKQAVAIETMSLAWTELKMEWHESWSKTPGVTLSSLVTQANLQRYIGTSGTIGTVTDNGDKTYTIEYIDNEPKKYLFLATENGKIELINGLVLSPSNLAIEYFTNIDTQISKTIEAGLQGIDGPVTWSVTAGSDVVSISSTSGNSIGVTPLKAGNATITASAENGDYTKTCSVTVTGKIAVSSIGSLTVTNTTVTKGSTVTVTAPNLSPNNATETLTWSSSDTSIATVSPSNDTKSATIAGVNEGEPVTITVTSANGDTSSVTVSVVEPIEISFNTDGGSSISSQIINKGATATRPTPNPTKEHYTFVNWYTDSSKTTVFDFNTILNETKIIYAKWTPDAYTITSTITNGSVASGSATSINYGESAIVTITPSSNYAVPSCSSDITVTGATLSNYDNTTGDVTLSNPTGNVTITATCPRDGLAGVFSVGDYVDIGVSYACQQSSGYIGWRVLDNGATSGTVKLISAGCPLNYYHDTNSSSSVSILGNMYTTLETSISNGRYFSASGFAGSSYDMTSIFGNNTYVDVSGGTSSIYASEYHQMSHLSADNNLRKIDKDYWLGKITNGLGLYKVESSGTISSGGGHACGVRLVVSLKSNLKISSSNTGDGSSSSSPWQLEVKN